MTSNRPMNDVDDGAGADDSADDLAAAIECDLGIAYALDKLGAQFTPEQLKSGQRKAIDAFMKKKDAMVILPTGHGKSIIYWSAPFLKDFKIHANACGCDTATHVKQTSIAVIVSPLIALMKDQVAALRREGVKAIYMGETSVEEEKQLQEGKFSLVFCSPEGILAERGTKLLSLSLYRSNVCGIFVDEGHCIAKWGYKSGKVAAFRSKYSRLAELRSFVKSKTPLLVLTATASPSVKNIMSSSLGLTNFVTVEESPERTNIRYSVITSSMTESNRDIHFGWLAKELAEKKGQCDKVLIFCKTNRNSRNLHATLTEHLQTDYEHLVALFSSVTEEKRKKEILADFTKPASKIRVLLATSAFGMGINVQGLHLVVGYGASRDIDDYFQESGRVGRDGALSHAILLNYKGNFGKGKTDKLMRNYVSTKDKCRREILMEQYGHKPSPPPEPHNCCDFCCQTCTCGGTYCTAKDSGKSDFEVKMRKTEMIHNDQKHVYRTPEDEVREIIKDQLLLFQDSLVTSGEEMLYTGKDIATGFSFSLISQIVANYEFIGTKEQLRKYPFFNEDHIEKVWNTLQEIGGEAEETGLTNDDDSSNDTSEYDSDYDIDTATLSDFEDDDFNRRFDYLSSQCCRIILVDVDGDDDD